MKLYGSKDVGVPLFRIFCDSVFDNVYVSQKRKGKKKLDVLVNHVETILPKLDGGRSLLFMLTMCVQRQYHYRVNWMLGYKESRYITRYHSWE